MGSVQICLAQQIECQLCGRIFNTAIDGFGLTGACDGNPVLVSALATYGRSEQILRIFLIDIVHE